MSTPEGTSSVSETPDNSELLALQLVNRRRLENRQRLELTLLKALSDAAKARYDEIRAEMRATTEQGTTFHPAIETGDPLDVAPVVVSEVIHTMAAKTLTIVDPVEFGRWLLAEYPDEAQTTAKKPFMQRLRDLAKRAGGRVCGPRGESEIPGLSMELSSDYVYAKPKADMMPMLFAQMRDQLPKMLEGGSQ